MKPRPIAAAFLLAVVALFCASCATNASGTGQSARHHATGVGAAPAAAATSLRTFDPFGSDGRVDATVARRTTGTCWTTSVAAAGSTALRCQAGNAILDPCFAASSGATTVACAADPWSAVVVMRVTGGLPHDPPMGDSIRPWALVLAGGAHCVALTGTVPMIAGVSLDYGCSDGMFASVPKPLERTVLADVGRPGATALRPVAVTTVWRG